MSSIKCLTIKKLKFNLPTLLKMPTKQDTLLLIHDFTRNLSFFFSFLNENHDTKPTTKKKKKKKLHRTCKAHVMRLVKFYYD